MLIIRKLTWKDLFNIRSIIVFIVFIKLIGIISGIFFIPDKVQDSKLNEIVYTK